MVEEDERAFGFLVSDTARLMRTVFDRRVRELGLTRSQWLVLTRLDRHPGASQSELADMLEVERATAGRLVDRLEQKGWVVRRQDPSDRRVNRIYPTPATGAVQRRIRAIAEATVTDALSDLSPAERQLATELMGRVKRRVQAMAEGAPSGRVRRPAGDAREGAAAGRGAQSRP